MSKNNGKNVTPGGIHLPPHLKIHENGNGAAANKDKDPNAKPQNHEEAPHPEGEKGHTWGAIRQWSADMRIIFPVVQNLAFSQTRATGKPPTREEWRAIVLSSIDMEDVLTEVGEERMDKDDEKHRALFKDSKLVPADSENARTHFEENLPYGELPATPAP